MSVTVPLLDTSFRKTSSVAFRLLIILYAISIYLRNTEKYNIYFAIATITYCILFFLLRSNKSIFRLLRLLDDYTYITYVLSTVGIENMHYSTFVLLPLINLINHTSEKIRQSFSIQLFIFSFLSIFYLNDFKSDFYFVIPIISIVLINLFVALRLFFTKVNDRLSSIIEDFYYMKATQGKNYLILRKAVDALNSIPVLGTQYYIKRVSIFYITKEKNLNIATASEFIYNYSIQFDEPKTNILT